METILDLLTDNQLLNMEQKIWRKMTDGLYHPYGIDENTMKITHPTELEALKAVRNERKERKI